MLVPNKKGEMLEEWVNEFISELGFEHKLDEKVSSESTEGIVQALESLEELLSSISKQREMLNKNLGKLNQVTGIMEIMFEKIDSIQEYVKVVTEKVDMLEKKCHEVESDQKNELKKNDSSGQNIFKMFNKLLSKNRFAWPVSWVSL